MSDNEKTIEKTEAPVGFLKHDIVRNPKDEVIWYKDTVGKLFCYADGVEKGERGCFIFRNKDGKHFRYKEYGWKEYSGKIVPADLTKNQHAGVSGMWPIEQPPPGESLK